jgi:hypothetical protein
VFHIEFVGIFNMHLHTDFDIPSFSFTLYKSNILKLHISQRSVKTKISELLPTLEVVAAAILVLLMSCHFRLHGVHVVS